MASKNSDGHVISFARALVLPALTFFLVPVLSLAFGAYGQRKIDGFILESINRSISADTERDEAQHAEDRAFFSAHPASTVCGDTDPALARYREAVCKLWGDTWQFSTALRVAWASIGLGLIAFLALAVLGVVAYVQPRAQYWGFMVGWRLLAFLTALVTVAQGALLVWLSYWVTALLFERYYPKLILIAAALAGLAVVAIVRALFRAGAPPGPLEAEPVRREDAPTLWDRIGELATRLGTLPPRVIAAGIDDNFFVTESPLSLASGSPGEGRLLYVSLPLLRTLSMSEADAVLGHELAHFKGGDTAASARLAPALVRFDAYLDTLVEGGLTVFAAMVMRLFRAVFELALSRERRRRELQADAVAARVTSPDDLGRALLKLTGYSDFRSHTERELFEHRAVHLGELGLKARIDAGLAAHAASPAFVQHVAALCVPHPFDSHPPLEERLASLEASVGVADARALLQGPPAESWIDAMRTATDIEARLWGAYEERFKANHELSLAWRYLPANDEERAIVEKHFPPLSFPVKSGGAVTLSYLTLTNADGAVAQLGDVREAKVANGTFTNELVLKVADASGKTRAFTVKLGPLGARKEEFKQAFAHYWKRAQVVRAPQ